MTLNIKKLLTIGAAVGCMLFTHSLHSYAQDTTKLEKATTCQDMYFFGYRPLVDIDLDMKSNLCFKNYAVEYSEQTQGALWAAEHLTKQDVIDGNNIKRSFNFDSRNPIIKLYKNTGFDRGHLAPSSDAPTLESQKQTFIWQNIVPQNHILNNGGWKVIENKAKKLAYSKGEVYVITGVIFKRLETTDTGLLIPSEMYKAVYVPKDKKAIAFVCGNNANKQCTSMTLKQLYDKYNMKPFPILDQSILNSRYN